MIERFYVFGTGAHARKVSHYLRLCGAEVAACVYVARGAAWPLAEVPAIHTPMLPSPRPHERMFVAVGAAAVRQRLMDACAARGWPLPALVHPLASVASDARLGDGVLVAAGAVVETGAVIGRGAIIDVGAIIDHDCRIGEFSHMHAGAICAPGTTIAPCAEVR